MLPILPTLFCVILVKFSVRELHVMLLNTCAVEAILHIGVLLNFAYIFYIFGPIWVLCLTADGYKNLLGDYYEFSKNQHSKKHTLLEGIIEFIMVLCMLIL
jgi:hypothetical protein